MNCRITARGVEASEMLAMLHASAFDETETWSAPAIAELLGVPGTVALCLMEGSAPAGFVMLRVVADQGEILTIAVAPAFRRRGIGRALIEAATREAAAHGAARLFLDVAEHNDAARALYAAAGFVEIGHRRHYYACGADARVLVTSLSAAT